MANQRKIPDKLGADDQRTTETIGQNCQMKILLPDSKQESRCACRDEKNLEDKTYFLFAEHVRQKADGRYEHGEEKPRKEEANQLTGFFPAITEQPAAEGGENEIERQKGDANDKGCLAEELAENMADTLMLLNALGGTLEQHLIDGVADDVKRTESQGNSHSEETDAGKSEGGSEQPNPQISADIIY